MTTEAKEKPLADVVHQRDINLTHPKWYLNRELTWLSFNSRVLHEATDERNPLLERLKFVAIVSSNLDEFFMKRVGGLKLQVSARLRALTVDGMSPKQQIDACRETVVALESKKTEICNNILQQCSQHGICICGYKDLNIKERKTLKDFFIHNVYPLLTPQSIDPAHRLPFISNNSLNILITLASPKGAGIQMARIKVPVGSGTARFIRIPGKKERFIPLEQLLLDNVEILFPGATVIRKDLFRIIRNANTEQDEETADDLLEMITTELVERKFAPVVRMEIHGDMPAAQRGILAAELGIDENLDVYTTEGLLAMRDLFQIAGLDYPTLRDRPCHAVTHPLLDSKRNVFHIIRDAGALLLQHPYESFSTSVERVLLEAASDNKVHGIKMTLYRTARQSNIIEALIKAAQNGKQVTVVVELKARFDEEANIRIAERMERAGIHVTYGIVGLKTHCKVFMIVRRDYDKLRRYVHIGTGNYNADTARIYTDLGLLSCDEELCNDVTELFNYLTTGLKPNRKYHQLLTAPRFLKKGLLARIEREIRLHTETSHGHIQFKVNALEDADITRALYQASRAGVKIDLLVRDSCRLRPGIPGVSNTVRVISVVGRFLEHSRVYYFKNGGDEEYFIGSADTMRRNLEARVEVICPIKDSSLRSTLREQLDVLFNDTRSSWCMHADGSYEKQEKADSRFLEPVHSRIIDMISERHYVVRKKQDKKKIKR